LADTTAPYSQLDIDQIRSVDGLDDLQLDVFKKLLARLAAKSTRNLLRERYFDSKQTVQQLGIAIPSQLRTIETILGWPAKAVEVLERRINFDGIVAPGTGVGPMGLDEIFAENYIDITYPQAHTEALKHSMSMLFVTNGDVASGEPEILMTPKSATEATGIWDSRRRMIAAALSVHARDAGTGDVTAAMLYLPDRVIAVQRNTSHQWRAVARPHGLGRVPVTLLAYKPDLKRPFGRSKISRAVMSLTDEAVRTRLRTEVGAEFYSVPQRYLLDLDPGSLDQGAPGWAAIIGRYLALERSDDFDAKTPTIGQFPQMSMQPHTEHFRQIAAAFSGETGLPVSSMGIIHDNPSSDAAMHTAYIDLVEDAERAAGPFGFGWVQASQLAIMLRDGVSTLSPEMRSLRARFRDPSRATRAANTDAVVKQVQQGILPAGSDVTLEALGYDAVTIRRLQADRRRSSVALITQSITERARAAEAVPAVAELTARRS
jgi:hypothetical protein